MSDMTEIGLEDAVQHIAARPCHFLKGVVDIAGLPAADRAEIAFAGRSNVGKSSLINVLVNQKGLARTSNTPGRTQEINYFELAPLGDMPGPYLVDLPGYGYAKASKSKVKVWNQLIRSYLRGRPNLRRVFLLIDSRHGVKDNDHQIMSMLDEAAVSYQVVLTKIDKLTPEAQDKAKITALADMKRHVAAFPGLIATSSAKGWGLDDLRAAVAKLVFDAADALAEEETDGTAAHD